MASGFSFHSSTFIGSGRVRHSMLDAGMGNCDPSGRTSFYRSNWSKLRNWHFQTISSESAWLEDEDGVGSDSQFVGGGNCTRLWIFL
ncbi:hypothetical protein IV203_009677 [Nitzschia inconspicua]|uniref:Uncharacterized protein n=1 Tax=Nitzschia inconspicua TaxID=303405 RepID=A0A9K3KVC8_9STRA|nr:hypothetical protein IV203_009677 [Nitzschia inconspicua]